MAQQSINVKLNEEEEEEKKRIFSIEYHRLDIEMTQSQFVSMSSDNIDLMRFHIFLNL